MESNQIKLKFLNLTNTHPPSDYIILTKSYMIPGYQYVISPDNYVLASLEFIDADESDELLNESSELWLAQLFDCSTVNEFEKMIIETVGGVQNLLNVISISQGIDPSALTETVVRESSGVGSLSSSQVSTAEISMEDTGFEEVTHVDFLSGDKNDSDIVLDPVTPQEGVKDEVLNEEPTPSASHMQDVEIPAPMGIDLSNSLSQPQIEEEINVAEEEVLSFTLEDFYAVQQHMRSISQENREVFSKFIEIVCSFSDDVRLSDKMMYILYNSILDALDSCLVGDQELTLLYYDMIVSKFLDTHSK